MTLCSRRRSGCKTVLIVHNQNPFTSLTATSTRSCAPPADDDRRGTGPQRRVQGDEHLTEEPLPALEAWLSEHGFLRVHRAELVRVDAVRAIHMQAGCAAVELSDAQHAKVSRRSLATVKAALGLRVS
jgi:LytTr DNA-binding domain